MPGDDARSRIAHLYRRAGFGARPDELDAAVAAGYEATVDRLVDLSHSFNRRTIYWPTAKRFRLTQVADGETEGGWHYAANDFEAAEHGGTHLDAPIHFSRTGDKAEDVPLRKLVGRAVNVDVRAPATADRDHLISVADLEAFEAAQGRMHVDVTVAHEPSAELHQEIRKSLSDIFKKTVVPHVHVDSRILGGIIVRHEDKVIDGSLRRRLVAMRRRLLEKA